MVLKVVSALKVFDALTVGEILHAKGVYSNLQSARVNAQKKQDKLVALGQLEKCDGFYRVPGCKSEYKEHSKLVTKALAEVLKLPLTSIIHREVVIPEVGLRSDAIVLITKDNRGLCLILEVVNHEPPEYLQSKINVWSNWPDDTKFLSELFNYKIPHYELVPVTALGGFVSFLQEATR